MSRSLSVLLPVKNVQATLNGLVHEILDAAADATGDFELLIIDDGSTDATSEVAHDLTRHYPQVRAYRHGASLGRDAAIQTGVKRSAGDVVVMRDPDGSFRLLQRRSPKEQSPSRPTRPNYLGKTANSALIK